jgi:hypothetical protein
MFNRTNISEGARGKNGHAARTKETVTAAIKSLDLPETIRKYPYPAVAIASGAGMVLGLTVGSRLVRMLVGSVGMYTVSELLRRYAKKALDDMRTSELGDVPVPPAQRD